MHLDDFSSAWSGPQIGNQSVVVHGRLLMHHRKRDEFGEAGSVGLDISEQVHVLTPVYGRFHMAVHNRGGRRNTETVRGRDHVNPLSNGNTSGGNDVADILIQNLRRCSGQRAETGFFESAYVIENRNSGARGAI